MKENSATSGVVSRYRRQGLLLVFLVVMFAVELVEELYLNGVQPATSTIFPRWLISWDITGFALLNKRLASQYLDPFMWLVTKPGSTTFWIIISGVLWVKNRRRDAILLATGVIIGGLIVLPIKVLLPRTRPYLVVEGARALDVNGGSSFPSGHSKNGFTAAAVLGSKWKKWVIPFYTLAFLIGLSRVYVGMHWPSDVVVGSIVGWVVGKATVRYENKIISVFRSVKL